jgi:hypothetical protein
VSRAGQVLIHLLAVLIHVFIASGPIGWAVTGGFIALCCIYRWVKGFTAATAIILALTQKHGGNVHTKGIVTITSLSVFADSRDFAPMKVADFGWDTIFVSKDAPGQWICWDFHKMVIQPTYYTIRAMHLKSWVLECSMEGRFWDELDRKTNTRNFKKGEKEAKFRVLTPIPCRFIRLTQTDRNHEGDDVLALAGVDFIAKIIR